MRRLALILVLVLACSGAASGQDIDPPKIARDELVLHKERDLFYIALASLTVTASNGIVHAPAFAQRAMFVSDVVQDNPWGTPDTFTLTYSDRFTESLVWSWAPRIVDWSTPTNATLQVPQAVTVGGTPSWSFDLTSAPPLSTTAIHGVSASKTVLIPARSRASMRVVVVGGTCDGTWSDSVLVAGTWRCRTGNISFLRVCGIQGSVDGIVGFLVRVGQVSVTSL